MGTSRRQSSLSKSIQSALTCEPDRFKKTALGQLMAFFSAYRIKLVRHEKVVFEQLRQDVWQFDEDEYKGSFHTTRGQPPLKAMGDLGYSGSVRHQVYSILTFSDLESRHSSRLSMHISL